MRGAGTAAAPSSTDAQREVLLLLTVKERTKHSKVFCTLQE